MNLMERITELERSAKELGFTWENSMQIIEQIHSECQEICEHLSKDEIDKSSELLQEEIGDLIHAAFSLCVFSKFDPSVTLDKALRKFERRLQAVKENAQAKGIINLHQLTYVQRMQLWEEAKQLEK